MDGYDERPSGQERDHPASDPVGVHEVGVVGSPAQRADHREKQEGSDPWPPLDVPYEPGAVIGEP